MSFYFILRNFSKKLFCKTPDTQKFTAEMQALISDISQDAGFNGVNGQLFKLYDHIKHHAKDRAKLLKFPKIYNLNGFGKVSGPDHTWNLQEIMDKYMAHINQPLEIKNQPDSLLHT